MKAEVFLPEDYRPAEDEPFMNERQLEYFRRKLLAWKADLGLLSEEYDVVRRRLIGNFPQGFSHIGLVNTAYNLSRAMGPARQRAEQDAPRA